MLQNIIIRTTGELIHLLENLNDKRYSEASAALNGTSIGEHTRHIIEIFQCLLKNYENGNINYDKRERNRSIEINTHSAIEQLLEIHSDICKPDKPLFLLQDVEGEEIKIETNYTRELLYNLEHCIHHQALIKLAAMEFKDIEMSENFGVAPSTIRYKNETFSAVKSN